MRSGSLLDLGPSYCELVGYGKSTSLRVFSSFAKFHNQYSCDGAARSLACQGVDIQVSERADL